MDTIFALASAPGKAGVSVIRISGSQAFDVVKQLAGRVPKPRFAALCKLVDEHGVHLDEALVLTFDAGASFTGERVAELQVHGSVAVVQAILDVLGQIDGLRLAEPGEFTRRALENGCMDLTQVEALSDLIEAETEAQRKHALTVLSGALAEKVTDWRTNLIRAAALLEATIDFADEEVPVDVTDEVRELITGVLADIQSELSGLSVAERVKSGFEVAIVGPPNAGKSTLLNYLAGRDAAITSEVAGTTRDVIEVRMDIGGMPVTLLDTAGLRQTDDMVEGIGVERAKSRADSADLRIHLVPEGEMPLLDVREEDIVAAAKQDVPGFGLGVSGKTGNGVDFLVGKIRAILSERSANLSLVSRARHKTVLTDGISHIQSALSGLDDGPDFYDITSEEVRVAIRALESLLGHVDVEHLLDEIFSSFCVGK
ncbi:tRNA uridine-5-carboxymethylaminomethyl(34) synthesis GTPase MnmE [Tropicibacter naphthalenivorans]|uniref:tRNA modification GTPase MnmE n=1 Tax=Tropicibacter naphthalenivorans TaxID=441103 RepID=A0A0P1GDM5_9RHOB|nr:tRNA uridine-5-carboxymethylaminomethyl(34) synthesis GTPase MnmE [Tropicibacter naphthalenivorans]CUH79652.1 tRNA modification GTPase MnmE [Tropicibacter naphthalenivorans]SMC74095.1 tRNA modification GTPase trmE [Tropicibacter naphthalenivorans]